ncbi:MAG TPA: chorismate synthase [Candidatus Kapabacteria bacterium]|nr:chorismate synthase [Candidatus Kapabacteria bacterium]
MPIRILTAGESHGKELIGIIDGIPAGLPLIASRDIDPILAERQKGYGRSYRQKIESDKAEIISGVRFGITTGAPIAIRIENKDWANWQEKMSVTPTDVKYDTVTIPRPGHADLAGAIKYDHKNDLRNILERASARETAMRVALGAVCSKLLSQLGITSLSFVTSIGKVVCYSVPNDASMIANSSVRIPDADLTTQAEALIDEAKRSGDTLGGAVQVQFTGLPVGVGSHIQWDRKLDGRIARAVMSIQAVKAVEIGDGVAVASTPGSVSHDEIILDDNRFSRSSNHAGGIEGGMSNGMPVVVRASMKPISTLMQPLQSIDLSSGEPASAHIERSDVCAVPALSIIVEQVVATEIASAIIDTFGGDTMNELIERIDRRRKQASIL